MIPIQLIEQEIDGVSFEVEIAPNVKVCTLRMNGISWFISEVDLAQIIRAVINSEDLYEFRKAIQGVWRDEDLTKLINCFIGGYY